MAISSKKSRTPKPARSVSAPADYQKIWQATAVAAPGADVIGSVSEAAINAYLARHRKQDDKRYKYPLRFPVDPTDPSKEFKADIEVGVKGGAFTETVPVEVYVPPFSKAEDGVFGLPSRAPAFIFPSDNESGAELGAAQPNVRVILPRIQLNLKWPKRKAQGEWEWTPPLLRVTANAKLRLVNQDDRFSIALQPTDIAIVEDSGKPFTDLVKYAAGGVLVGKLTKDDEAKFNDLLLTVLNYLGGTVAPQLVSNIEIPIYEYKGLKLYPTALQIGGVLPQEKLITIAGGIDLPAMATKNQKVTQTWLAKLNYALEIDVATAGGLEGLAYGRSVTSKAERIAARDTRLAVSYLRTQAVRAPKEIEKDLRNARAVIDELKREVDRSQRLEPSMAARRSASRVKTVTVTDGAGVGFNERVLNALLASALPAPKSECREEKPLVLVKGKICYWAAITRPSAQILPPKNLKGAADVDFGAALHFWLKRFLDCSWTWGDEHIVSLSIEGRPSVTLGLISDNNGLRVDASVDTGNLSLKTSLGSVVDAILNVLFSLFKKSLEVLVNLLLKLCSFVVIPIAIKIPTQNTAIRFSGFKGFVFDVPAPSPARARFLGHTADLSPD